MRRDVALPTTGTCSATATGSSSATDERGDPLAVDAFRIRRHARDREPAEAPERVKGIGVVLIGEGDLSQELGRPRDYEHPVVAEAIDRVPGRSVGPGVPCGHPHPDAKNIERIMAASGCRS